MVPQTAAFKDYAPRIAENGLDPTCGHLAKGSWLGGVCRVFFSLPAVGVFFLGGGM